MLQVPSDERTRAFGFHRAKAETTVSFDGIQSRESIRAIAFGFFTHRFQAGKLIQAASASFSMRKSAFLRAMCEEINTVRSRIQTVSGCFWTSDVKKIPNAMLLEKCCFGPAICISSDTIPGSRRRRKKKVSDDENDASSHG